MKRLSWFTLVVLLFLLIFSVACSEDIHSGAGGDNTTVIIQYDTAFHNYSYPEGYWLPSALITTYPDGTKVTVDYTNTERYKNQSYSCNNYTIICDELRNRTGE